MIGFHQEPQIIVSEQRILEQPIQLSAPGRHVNVAFQTVCKLSISRSLFPFDRVPSTLAFDAPPRTSFLVRDHMSSLSHGFTSFAGTSCELPLAAAC